MTEEQNHLEVETQDEAIQSPPLSVKTPNETRQKLETKQEISYGDMVNEATKRLPQDIAELVKAKYKDRDGALVSPKKKQDVAEDILETISNFKADKIANEKIAKYEEEKEAKIKEELVNFLNSKGINEFNEDNMAEAFKYAGVGNYSADDIEKAKTNPFIGKQIVEAMEVAKRNQAPLPKSYKIDETDTAELTSLEKMKVELLNKSANNNYRLSQGDQVQLTKTLARILELKNKNNSL